MATSSMGHGEVKSICDSLECSPSQHQGTSMIYGGSHDNPKAKKAKGGKSATEGAESDLGKTSRKKAAKVASAD